MRRSVATVLVAALALAVGGCGGESLPRPITGHEADLLSEVFFTNYDKGGASFSLHAALPDGATVTLEGDVDFYGEAGFATVSATGPDASVTEVGWGGGLVFERIPKLTALAQSTGQGQIDYVSHAADPDTRTLDALIAVVMGLASDVRENPLLLQQNGVTLVRRDTLQDVDVDVFQYGERTRVWIEHETSVLRRFEGNNAVGSRPVVIDITDLGPQEITLPTGSIVVTQEQAADLYDATR